jgi:hypothetical protein
MKEHEFDQVVQRFVTGEPLSREERAALENSPAHWARAQEMRSLQGTLDQASERERAALFREAAALDSWPGRAAFHGRLRELMQATPARPRRRRILQVLALVAAAVLLFVLSWVRGPTRPAEPREPNDVFVGGDAVHRLFPVGEVERFERFRWEYELTPGGRFELRIWDAAAPADAEALVRLELQEPGWTPGADVSLPEAIRWQVRAFGATNLESVATCEARRRRP